MRGLTTESCGDVLESLAFQIAVAPCNIVEPYHGLTAFVACFQVPNDRFLALRAHIVGGKPSKYPLGGMGSLDSDNG